MQRTLARDLAKWRRAHGAALRFSERRATPDAVTLTDELYRVAKAERQLVTVSYRAVGLLSAPPVGFPLGRPEGSNRRRRQRLSTRCRSTELEVASER